MTVRLHFLLSLRSRHTHATDTHGPEKPPPRQKRPCIMSALLIMPTNLPLSSTPTAGMGSQAEDGIIVIIAHLKKGAQGMKLTKLP